ncbi:basic blue protein-like [Rhodamnia argentea]|uniref:Basic blue protein-like n=1 Tax=Rhodamnia argentea TaxID=178133 RepID=A0A8B8PLH2_9MYRT|nr:basic blue protein-like [Rhodamnia argentea]
MEERRNPPQKCLDIARAIFQSWKMGRLVAVVTCLVLSCVGIKNASGAEYTVGDERGWTIDIEGWTQGKKFRPGDVLIFKYDPLLHNVVAVDLDSYDTCTLGEKYKMYDTGNDRVVLEKGNSFFFSSEDGDCDKKMKIEVHAWDFPPRM